MEQGDHVGLHLGIRHLLRQITPIVMHRVGDGEIVHGTGGIAQLFPGADVQIIAAQCGEAGICAVKKVF